MARRLVAFAVFAFASMSCDNPATTEVRVRPAFDEIPPQVPAEWRLWPHYDPGSPYVNAWYTPGNIGGINWRSYFHANGASMEWSWEVTRNGETLLSGAPLTDGFEVGWPNNDTSLIKDRQFKNMGSCGHGIAGWGQFDIWNFYGSTATAWGHTPRGKDDYHLQPECEGGEVENPECEDNNNTNRFDGTQNSLDCENNNWECEWVEWGLFVYYNGQWWLVDTWWEWECEPIYNSSQFGEEVLRARPDSVTVVLMPSSGFSRGASYTLKIADDRSARVSILLNESAATAETLHNALRATVALRSATAQKQVDASGVVRVEPNIYRRASKETMLQLSRLKAAETGFVDGVGNYRLIRMQLPR